MTNTTPRIIELRSKYKSLVIELEEKYPNSSFKDHCYWRIANDCATQSKWSDLVARPYYKNATEAFLERSVMFLEYMLISYNNVLRLNRYSLRKRKKI